MAQFHQPNTSTETAIDEKTDDDYDDHPVATTSEVCETF